ncbi:MAG: hypothetical protein J6Y74_02090 [Clostridia bacterium]|nr:hypothetical protein [Clostridia bacterium]
MTLAKCCKNKKGVALTYAVMVLFLLATVIVAITALASSSVSEAVLTASDDQSYFYAKSIGLAIKEQFKDGYNINSIIETLDAQIAEDESSPCVTGKYYVEDDSRTELVEGTVRISYAKDSAGNGYNDHVLEVKVACVYNNSLSIVTSVFSCEEDAEEVMPKLKNAFDKYDVILTNKDEVSFDFADTSASTPINVYVYVGEDDTVKNSPFYLGVDMNGNLTTTGDTKIYGGTKSAETQKSIKGDLTAYGNLSLKNVKVTGTNGIHCDANVTINKGSFVTNSIFARGDITLSDEEILMHNHMVNSAGYVETATDGSADLPTVSTQRKAVNLVAMGNVTMGEYCYITGSIYARGDVTIKGHDMLHVYNTWVDGSVYANGAVTISKGAVVMGDVIATGKVTIQSGAIVFGNVQSKGDVTVNAGVVGGKVECIGKLTLKTNTTYGNWLAQKGATPQYEILFGGIGIFRGYNNAHSANKIIHTCGSLSLGDTDEWVRIIGDIYVENSSASGKYTPLTSVWIPFDSIYLLNSRAIFGAAADQTVTNGYQNQFGNPHVYIHRLWQNGDLYYTSGEHLVNMNGAKLDIIQAGDQGAPRDVCLTNGTVTTQIIGRCGELKMMDIAYCLVEMKQYLKVYGDGSTSPLVTNGITMLRSGSQLNVNCETSGKGSLTNNEVGLEIGQYVNMLAGSQGRVGSASTAASKGKVILGSSAAANTYLFGNYYIHAKEVELNAGAHLRVPSGSGTSAAVIYADVETFTVKDTSSLSTNRTASVLYLKGNLVLQGKIFSVYHFSGNLTMTGNGSVAGTYWSKSNGKLQFKGTFGSIEASDAGCTVELSGALNVTNDLRVNGTLVSGNYDLVVGKDLYVRALASGTLSKVTVNGNMTISEAQTSYTIGAGCVVAGTLTCTGSAITLDSTAKVGGVASKSLVIKGNAVLGGNNAKSKVTNGITMSGGTMTACKVQCYNFTQTAGTLSSVDMYVGGTGTVINVSGSSKATAAHLYAPNGAFSFSGGSSVQYTGGENTLQAKTGSTLKARFEGGVTVTGGNLAVGAAGESGTYNVGSSGKTIYASGTLTWLGGARSPYDADPSGGAPNISAGGNITIGTFSSSGVPSGDPIKGYFNYITSSSGRVWAYVEAVVKGAYASGDVTMKVSKSFGNKVNDKSVGIYTTGGNINLYASANTIRYKGYYITPKTFTVASALSMTAAVKCSDASGLNNIREETASGLSNQKAIFLSLQITGSSSSRFSLERSLAKDSTGTTGSITLENRGLTLSSGKHVEGIIYVNGIYYYGTSSVDLDSVGGLYCKNTEVNTVNLKGDIELPNVTSVIIGSSITSLKADKVASVTLGQNFPGSLNLPNVGTLTVNSGITVSGALEIGGTLENKGTINGGAKCKKYTGSGVVKGNLIITGSEQSEITGNVAANIYSYGPLLLKNATNLGASGGYIFSKSNIDAEYVTFRSDLSYIMSNGGYQKYSYCKQLPNVRALSGATYIQFINNTDCKTTIKSVWSKGTSIQFGTSTSSNYQTITGDLEWSGTMSSGTTQGIYIRSKNTVIQGNAKFTGTGYVQFYGQCDKDVLFYNTSKVILGNSSFPALVKGNVYVNTQSNNTASVKVTNFVYNAGEIQKDLYYYGSGQSVTVNGSVTGMLRADNVHLTVGGSLGSLLHTASSAGYKVNLGSLSNRPKVNGSIRVRGVLFDNSENHDTINVYGAYYGDVNKIYKYCTGIKVTAEDSGASTGWTWIFGGPSADYISGNVDVTGWLFIYSNANDAKFEIKGNIYCNLLHINNYWYVNGGWTNYYPMSGHKRFDSSTQMVDIVSAGFLPVQPDYEAAMWANQSTTRDLVTVRQVHVKAGNGKLGAAYCANTKMQHLRTDGQICLTYCYLTSKNFDQTKYNNTGEHCGNHSNSNGISVKKNADGDYDGSIIAHNASTDAGWNMFWGTKTVSNVSLIYGFTCTNGDGSLADKKGWTDFEGSVKENVGTGVTGSVATKLFYFGGGLAMYGYSRINSARNGDTGEFKADLARTIVWIGNGDLYVGVGCGVGHDKTDLSRTRVSSHPGVFVSNGNATIDGYVTLDMMVKGNLTVTANGEVLGKDSGGSSYRAGVFLVGGSLSEVSNHFRLKHAYTSSALPARAYETNWGGDCYTPDASGYVSYMTGKLVKISGTNAANLAQCYKPKNTAVTVSSPSGAGSSTSPFKMSGRSAAENATMSTSVSSYSAPTEPTLSAGAGTSIGTGTASVPKLALSGTIAPVAAGDYKVAEVTVPTVTAAETNKTFSIKYSIPWAEVTYGQPSFAERWATAEGVDYTTLAESWEKGKVAVGSVNYSLTQHLDKSNSSLWGPRVIPQTWQLPYEYTNSSGGTTETPAKRVLVGKMMDSAGINLSDVSSSVANEKKYVTEDIYNSGSNSLKSYNQNTVISDRKKTSDTSYAGTNKLLDYIMKKSTSGVDRCSDLLVFESGELPYSAFYMSATDDFTVWSRIGRGHVGEKHDWKKLGVTISSWEYFYWKYMMDGNSDVPDRDDESTFKNNYFTNSKNIPYSAYHGNSEKKIAGQYQDAWFWGSEERSTYDVNWIFYACKDPSNPYDSAAKDLHVVLPKGIGLEFFRDIDNKILVIGRGRVFLYLTSGDTLYFRGDIKSDNNPTTWVVGGLTNKDRSGKYLSSDKQYKRPQLYIIGAGTNIDLIVRELQLFAYVYMPFGTNGSLYNASTGRLKSYNIFKNAEGGKANPNSAGSASSAVTDVKRNSLMFVWDAAKSKRYIYGSIVVDNFNFTTGSDKNLEFKARAVDRYGPDFGDTKIYGASTYSGSTVYFSTNYVEVSLTSFMSQPPGFSTTMLNWDYVGIKVVS